MPILPYVLLAAGLLGLLPPTLSLTNEQSRPDFSGVWKLEIAEWKVPPKSAAGPPAAPGADPEITIWHSGQMLTMTRPLGGTIVPVRHVLDGSRVSTRVPARLCRADSEGTWTATWSNADIVIVMVAVGREGGGPTIPNDVKTTLHLESADRLRVDVDFRPGGSADRVVRSARYLRTGPPPDAPAVPPAAAPEATIADVAWLSGDWAAADRGAQEIWTEPVSGSMQGLGRVLRDQRLSSFEFLCIAERLGSLVYLAMPEGRMPPTEFRLALLEPTRAAFENPANRYPKRIEYALRPDGKLEATLSGDAGQRVQTFVFSRR